MDVVHLQPEELDYELGLRGVYNLSTQRMKTQSLRDFLKREDNGEQTIIAARVKGLDVACELSMCTLTVDDVVAKWKDPSLGQSVVKECHSRLVHVIGRLGRIKPRSPEEQVYAADLVAAAESHLARMYSTTVKERLSDRHTMAVSSKIGASPLADVIEAIHNGQQAAGQVDECGAVGFSRSVERPSLNPHVAEFRPKDVSAIDNPFGYAVPPSFEGVVRTAASKQMGSLADLFSGATYNEREQFRRREQPISGVRQGFAAAPSVRDQHQHENAFSVSSGSARDADRPIGRQQFRNDFAGRRKTVPVHQWRISFSGDGQGLHLYDFLSELSMFQRSEGVCDEELFASVVHLLTGRARLWYRSWFDTFGCWTDFVSAIKKEFLPPKYDYRLLSSISNRRQKPSETFAEYLNVMQSLFKYLSIPIDDQHKLCIVEENMLSKYVIAVSAIDVQSLEQLANVCRRIDFAYNKQALAMPLDGVAPQTRSPFRQDRSRELHEVEARMNAVDELSGGFAGMHVGESDDRRQAYPPCSSTQVEGEILAVRERVKRVGDTGSERKCFNCLREGHNFADCQQPKTGQFCFRCGSRNVTVFTCKNCTKNAATDSAQHGGVQSPQNN